MKKITETSWLASSPKSPLQKTVGSLLHDLNNPLTVLSARSFQLQQYAESANPDPQKLKDLSHSLSLVAEKLVQQVHLLKVAVKAPAQDALLTCKCQTLIQECLNIIQSQALEQPISWSLEDQTRDFEVKILPLHFQQLLLHLLLNAVQAVSGNPDAWIKLSSSVDGRFWTVRLENSSAAPKESHEGEIFEAFYTTKSQQAGLGLTLAKHLAQELGASLYRKSEYAHSCFEVQIPIF